MYKPGLFGLSRVKKYDAKNNGSMQSDVLMIILVDRHTDGGNFKGRNAAKL